MKISEGFFLNKYLLSFLVEAVKIIDLKSMVILHSTNITVCEDKLRFVPIYTILVLLGMKIAEKLEQTAFSLFQTYYSNANS